MAKPDQSHLRSTCSRVYSREPAMALQRYKLTLANRGTDYQDAIWNRADRPAFFGDLVWHRWQELDVDGMKRAASQLVGEHDFASFARPGHGRENTVRTVLACEVSRRAALLVIGVEGTGFL